MSLKGYLASVKVESSSIVFTDEATTTSDNTTYQITDTAKRLWKYGVDIVVKDGGVETTESFTFNGLKGTVTFESALARTITISGEYVVATTVANAKNYNFGGSADALDDTKFNVTGFRSFVAGLRTATATIGTWYLTNDVFYPIFVDGSVKIIELYPSPTDEPIKFYGFITQEQINAPVEGLLDQSVTFQVTTQFDI